MELCVTDKLDTSEREIGLDMSEKYARINFFLIVMPVVGQASTHCGSVFWSLKCRWS